MEITQKEINEIHPIATEMLKVFIDVCDKLNLRYYIFYGTLIGTVRHKGFIPWDDDIDIVMPRKDYDVLINCAHKYLPDNYFLQTPYSEPNYIFAFAKLRKSDTTYVENRLQYIYMNQGLWLDIFCLDYEPQSWWHRVKVRNIRQFNDYATYDSQQSPKIKKSYSLFRQLAVKFFRVIFKNTAEAQQKSDKLYKSIPPASRYVTNNSPYNEKIPVEWFGDGIFMKFEGINVKVPSEYDKCLKLIYGDYMQLPPEEKRIPRHEVAAYDLTKPYTDYYL